MSEMSMEELFDNILWSTRQGTITARDGCTYVKVSDIKKGCEEFQKQYDDLQHENEKLRAKLDEVEVYAEKIPTTEKYIKSVIEENVRLKEEYEKLICELLYKVIYDDFVDSKTSFEQIIYENALRNKIMYKINNSNQLGLTHYGEALIDKVKKQLGEQLK